MPGYLWCICSVKAVIYLFLYQFSQKVERQLLDLEPLPRATLLSRGTKATGQLSAATPQLPR